MSSIAFPPDDTTTTVSAPATPTPTGTDLPIPIPRDLAADHAAIDHVLDAMRARHRAEREQRDHITQASPAHL